MLLERLGIVLPKCMRLGDHVLAAVALSVSFDPHATKAVPTFGTTR
jgi:hypothetical protein